MVAVVTGTKIIVPISEVFLFQRENTMYSYEVGTQSSVLINQVSFISEVFFKRGSTARQKRLIFEFALMT